MAIKPRNYLNFDAFADAFAHDAVKALPVPHVGDDYAASASKRAAIRAAMDAAEERAQDIWWHHVEACEDRHERGVGHGWA